MRDGECDAGCDVLTESDINTDSASLVFSSFK